MRKRTGFGPSFGVALLAIAALCGAVSTLAEVEEELSMEGRCRAEVVELHEFFEQWYGGELEASNLNFTRFADSMAEGLVFISTSGRTIDRQELLSGVRSGHNSWGGAKAHISIEGFEVRHAGAGWAVATYQEWQEISGNRRGRQSTVVFRDRPGLPNDLEWVHVHETWLP